MAKKKIQAAEIVITTTDGGSFKVTEKEAKRLAKQIDKLGGASQQTDRRIKGVTGQSSNASKNFSKQAQTMQGGIVAVYATIAAQIFAVSAAYQFLKNSFETRNLIEGQKQFGAVTGVAYQSITRNVQEATGNMLQFKEAASGVAIGVAAGLSAGSLEKLGAAAKNASLALGRDVTDSFNRLIKGVTKAEPELLDELGIVLRLENATTKYGVAIGKTREQLNAYERTQAVLNDVLEQAETKYRIIGEVMDPDAFALGQLTKEIDELMMKFQVFVAEGLMPLINFFKENALALVGAMGLFVLPIIRSLLPDLGSAMEKAAIRSSTASSAMKDSFLEAKDAMTASRLVSADPVGTRKESAAGLKGLGVKSFKGGDDQLNARQIAAYKRHMKEKTGIYKKFSMKERAAFRKHLLQQEAALRQSTGKQVGIVSKGEYQKQAISKMTTAVVLWGEKQKQRAMAFTAKWSMRLMSMMGWIGIFAMLIQGIISLVNWIRDLDEEQKRLREETKKTTEDLNTLNEELGRMGDVRLQNANLLTLKMSVEQLGNALQSTDIAKQIAAYHRELEKGNDAEDEVIMAFAKMAEELAVLSPEFKDLYEEMREGNILSEAMQQNLERITSGMINAGMAAKSFAQNQESLNKSLDKTIRKFAKVPYQDLEKNLAASIQGIKDELGIISGVTVDGAVKFGGKGAKFMEDPAMKDLLGERLLSDLGQYKVSSEFGMFAETENRVAEREQKRADFEKRMRSSSAYNQFDMNRNISNTQMPGYQTDPFHRDKKGNVTGILSDMEAIDAGMMASTNFIWGQDKFLESLETLRQEYKLIAQDQEALNEQEKEDLESKKLRIDYLREQMHLNKNVNLLQKHGADLAEDKAENLRDQARYKNLAGEKDGVKLTELGNQQAEKTAQIAASTFKIRAKELEKEAALLAVQHAEEKIRTALLDKHKDNLPLKNRILAMDQETLALYIQQNDHQDQELENMKKAVGIADMAIDQQEDLSSLEMQKLLVQREALVNSKDLALFAKEQAMWALAYKNAMVEANRIMKQAGSSPDAKAANRATRLAQLTGDKDTGGTDMGQIARAGAGATSFATMASGVRKTRNTYDSLDVKTRKVTGAETYGGEMGGKLGESMEIDGKTYTKYLQPVTEAQKLYNSYLDKANTQKQVGIVLGEKQLDLENQIAGVYIQGSLAAKTALLKIDRETIANLNPASKIYWEEINRLRDDGVVITQDHIDATKIMANEQVNLGIEIELLNGIQNTLSNGFQSMFQSLIDGTKSFKDSMKDLAKSVLADLAAMFLKAAALKFMLAMFPGMGGGTGTFSSLFGKGDEGLGGDRYGGIRSGYGTGGVAKGAESGYLAKLHGTEAIVPLGNDRAIPVDLRGGGGNVVNVAVNISGQGASTQSTGAGDAAALGRSIGGLVQQHLQTEMRPGGLLNRQGATGRGGG